MNVEVVIIGAGGHGRAIADIILSSEDLCVGFVDNDKPVGEYVLGIPIIGKDEDIIRLSKKGYKFIIGIGNNYIRKRIVKTYNLINWYTAIHPTCYISRFAMVGEGTVVMPKCVVHTEASVGKHCIINTASIIEHENIIEDYVHISPNVALSGNVKIGECSHIGTGVSVRDGISIGKNIKVGVAAGVVSDLKEEGIYFGTPAKLIKQ